MAVPDAAVLLVSMSPNNIAAWNTVGAQDSHMSDTLLSVHLAQWTCELDALETWKAAQPH